MTSEEWYQSINEEVLTLEDIGFQLQQGRLSPHRRLSTIVTLPIPQAHFRLPPNSNPQITSNKFTKTMHHNPKALTTYP